MHGARERGRPRRRRGDLRRVAEPSRSRSRARTRSSSRRSPATPVRCISPATPTGHGRRRCARSSIPTRIGGRRATRSPGPRSRSSPPTMDVWSWRASTRRPRSRSSAAPAAAEAGSAPMRRLRSGCVFEAEGRLADAERELAIVEASSATRSPRCTTHGSWSFSPASAVVAGASSRHGRRSSLRGDDRRARRLRTHPIARGRGRTRPAGTRIARPETARSSIRRAMQSWRSSCCFPEISRSPDRRGALSLAEHDPDPYACDLPQARRQLASGRRRPRRRARPARANGIIHVIVGGRPRAPVTTSRCSAAWKLGNGGSPSKASSATTPGRHLPGWRSVARGGTRCSPVAVRDQAELQFLLQRVTDLGLTLLDATVVDDAATSTGRRDA